MSGDEDAGAKIEDVNDAWAEMFALAGECLDAIEAGATLKVDEVERMSRLVVGLSELLASGRYRMEGSRTV